MYKVTTKEKKKKDKYSAQQPSTDLPFMRSDPQSNQRYETNPINYLNT